MFSPIVFGRFWQTLFLWFSTSMVVWIGLSLLGGILWWVSWTCCLMKVLWLGPSLLQYEWKPFNVRDESFVDFYLFHNDEFMFCNVLLTSCVLTFHFEPISLVTLSIIFQKFSNVFYYFNINTLITSIQRLMALLALSWVFNMPYSLKFLYGNTFIQCMETLVV